MHAITAKTRAWLQLAEYDSSAGAMLQLITEVYHVLYVRFLLIWRASLGYYEEGIRQNETKKKILIFQCWSRIHKALLWTIVAGHEYADERNGNSWISRWIQPGVCFIDLRSQSWRIWHDTLFGGSAFWVECVYFMKTKSW